MPVLDRDVERPLGGRFVRLTDDNEFDGLWWIVGSTAEAAGLDQLANLLLVVAACTFTLALLMQSITGASDNASA